MQTDAKDLERIRDEIVAALSAISCVRAVDSFGSLASGSADRWSDLDLLVACETPEQTAWLAAGAIRAAKRVAFFRMFTGVVQPSGRYWFEGESPFHKLDISFHRLDERQAVASSGVRLGHPIDVKVEYEAHRAADPAADLREHVAAAAVDVTPRETEIGSLLYIHLLAAKDHLRDQDSKWNMADTRRLLLDAAAAGPIIAGGGDLAALIDKTDDFIQSKASTAVSKGRTSW